jgi:hypothetical protein
VFDALASKWSARERKKNECGFTLVDLLHMFDMSSIGDEKSAHGGWVKFLQYRKHKCVKNTQSIYLYGDFGPGVLHSLVVCTHCPEEGTMNR